MMFKKFRRRLAAMIAGEQPMLSLSNHDGAALRAGNWDAMTDEGLVATMRYGFASIDTLVREKAKRTAVPLGIMVVSDACMSLIRHARETNADTTTINQSGDIGGEDIGVWQITVTKAPADFEFPEPGYLDEQYEGDRLVRLAYSVKVGA